MAAPKGNKNGLGNKGGGRISIKDEIWHKNVWELETNVRELESKIATGVYSVRQVYQLKALKADTVILKNIADKVLANLVDVTSKGEKIDSPSVESLPKYDAIRQEYEDKLKQSLLEDS
jgi:hypothetical protein